MSAKCHSEKIVEDTKGMESESEFPPLEMEIDDETNRESCKWKENGSLITLPTKFYYLDVHL